MSTPEELHLRDYLKVIVRRRQGALLIFSLVMLAFVFVVFTTTPIYMASTKVLIEKSKQGGGMLTGFYYPDLYDPEFYETQHQLIKSLSVGEKAVDMLMEDGSLQSYLARRKQGGSEGSSPGFLRSIAIKAGLAKPPEKPKPDDAGQAVEAGQDSDMDRRGLASMISGSISLSPVVDSKIVVVNFTSADPEFSAVAVNTIIEAYMEQLLEMRLTSTRHAMKWMTEKAEAERENLDRSEQALQAYKRKNDIVTLENRVTVLPEKLNSLGTQMVQADAKRKELASINRKVESYGDDYQGLETIPSIASDTALSHLNREIMLANQRLTELSKKYGQKHPAMKKAQADLEGLQSRKIDEIARIRSSIRTEYDLAAENYRNLQNLMEETRGEALDLNEKFIQFEILRREVETNKQLYESLIKRIKEQGFMQNVSIADVWVVQDAITPQSPVKPRKRFLLSLGFVLAIFSGLAFALFLDYVDNTIKTPEETENALDMPVVGVVSYYVESEGLEDVLLSNQQTTLGEEYKSLRTTLLLSSADSPPRSMLITSAGPSEGKTATCINLAVSIAQSGRTVILVDADMRRPRTHRVLGVKNEKGLSTYLSGISELEDVVTAGKHPEMSLITAGPIPPNPTELLSSLRLSTLNAELLKKFDFVIWDSPPILTAADSLILSKTVNGVLLVSYAGKTTYDAVRKAVKQLDDIGGHILGLIINALDYKKEGYQYYSYKYYHYNYGDYKPDADDKGKKSG